MFCNYLNGIYKNHIHSNLIDDEFNYSMLLEETFLDLWNQVYKKIKLNNGDIIYYNRNGDEIFHYLCFWNMFSITNDWYIFVSIINGSIVSELNIRKAISNVIIKNKLITTKSNDIMVGYPSPSH